VPEKSARGIFTQKRQDEAKRGSETILRIARVASKNHREESMAFA
jgi:hypothetical protein